MGMPKGLEKMLKSRIESALRESDESLGFMTDAEKVAHLELETMQKQIEQLGNKLETKARLFWGNIETRLDIYDKKLHINEKTGEIKAEEPLTKESMKAAVAKALKGTPFEEIADRFDIFETTNDDEDDE